MPMMSIVIVEEQSDAWKDLRTTPYINAMGNDTPVAVCALSKGMKSGKASVTFRVDAPSGEIMLFETSLAMLQTVVGALVAKFGNQLEIN